MAKKWGQLFVFVYITKDEKDFRTILSQHTVNCDVGSMSQKHQKNRKAVASWKNSLYVSSTFDIKYCLSKHPIQMPLTFITTYVHLVLTYNSAINLDILQNSFSAQTGGTYLESFENTYVVTYA